MILSEVVIQRIKNDMSDIVSLILLATKFPDILALLAQIQELVPNLGMTKLQDSISDILAKFNVSPEIQKAISRLIAIPPDPLTFVSQALKNSQPSFNVIEKLSIVLESKGSSLTVEETALITSQILKL